MAEGSDRGDDADTPIDAAYIRALRAEFPRLTLRDKGQSPLSHAIDRALRAVTLGGQRFYLTHYVTTLGQTIYVPSDWAARTPVSRYLTLRHEAVHLRQFARLGWAAMSLWYVFPVFPFFLAYGRAQLEREAYAETLRATWEVLGPAAARDPALHRHIREQFTGSAYGWMWPFPKAVQRWIDDTLDELAAGSPGGSPGR